MQRLHHNGNPLAERISKENEQFSDVGVTRRDKLQCLNLIHSCVLPPSVTDGRCLAFSPPGVRVYCLLCPARRFGKTVLDPCLAFFFVVFFNVPTRGLNSDPNATVIPLFYGVCEELSLGLS